MHSSRLLAILYSVGQLLIPLKPACDDADCEGKKKVCQAEVSPLLSFIHSHILFLISDPSYLG